MAPLNIKDTKNFKMHEMLQVVQILFSSKFYFNWHVVFSIIITI
jgi:hypothetical protein